MHFVLTVLLCSFAFKRADWHNWRKYALTIQYVILSNLLYNVLCHDHRLWEYEPDMLPKSHVLVDLIYTFINLPAITLLFLTFYPYAKEKIKQGRYIAYWIVSSMLIEYPFIFFGRLHLKNGYEYWMDFLFYIVMYSLIRLHFTRPLLTYGISLVFVVLLLLIFKIPLN